MTDTSSENTGEKPKTNRLRALVVVITLLAGLALAPGYLLLYGHESGARVADYDVTCAQDANAPDCPAINLALTTDMNPVAFNIIVTTAFRDYAGAESEKYRAWLSYDTQPLWTADFYLGHGRRKEAIAGTDITYRLKTFSIERDGDYRFVIHRPTGMEGIRRMRLEVRKNVPVPNTWIIGLGLLIIAGVMVWAVIPAKGYDYKAERTGTQWYAD